MSILNESLSKFEVSLRIIDKKGLVKPKTIKVNARNSGEAASKARKKYQDLGVFYDIDFVKSIPDSFLNVDDSVLKEAEPVIDFDKKDDATYSLEMSLQFLNDIIQDIKDGEYDDSLDILVDDLETVKAEILSVL